MSHLNHCCYMHEYAGIGGLSFMGQKPKCRDLNVARSHRHYLSANENAVQDIASKRYGQTTYTENFYDQRAGTNLKLGPQFQFYDTEDEEEESNTNTTLKSSESNESIASTIKTNEQANSNSASVNVSAYTSKTGQTSESKPKQDQEEGEQNEETIERPKITDSDLTKTAAWPAWPGNRCNHIDPVTLKIAEKTDVNCLQDKEDVKAMKQSILLQQPDYIVLKDLDQAPIAAGEDNGFAHKFAPAAVNFAYSGTTGYYGSKHERDNQIDFINLKEKLMPYPRHKPLCRRLTNNVNKFISHGQDLPPVAVKESESIDELNNTLNNLREPSYPTEQPQLPPKREKLLASRGSLQKKVSFTNFRETEDPSESEEHLISRQSEIYQNYQSLPPLWETLDYTSTRVIDQLGVRFKSAAQNRYHQLYPESGSTGGTTSFSNLYLKQADRHTTYRRQYYNGHHMGSSFR